MGLIDLTDKELDKRPPCSYCKLPINKGFILVNEKIYFYHIINRMTHPECVGPYINSLKNKVISFFGVGLSIIALIISIMAYYI
jgi:hypothetical protein